MNVIIHWICGAVSEVEVKKGKYVTIPTCPTCKHPCKSYGRDMKELLK